MPHGLSLAGLEPRFITTAELPLAGESRAAAEREIDALWAPAMA
ncbi:hypothetical protein [Amycolatopsis alkalitolerans]